MCRAFYWLMDIRANAVLKEGMEAVKIHNELATGWANSLKEWNDDCYELISAI